MRESLLFLTQKQKTKNKRIFVVLNKKNKKKMRIFAFLNKKTSQNPPNHQTTKPAKCQNWAKAWAGDTWGTSACNSFKNQLNIDQNGREKDRNTSQIFTSFCWVFCLEFLMRAGLRPARRPPAVPARQAAASQTCGCWANLCAAQRENFFDPIACAEGAAIFFLAIWSRNLARMHEPAKPPNRQQDHQTTKPPNLEPPTSPKPPKPPNRQNVKTEQKHGLGTHGAHLLELCFS